MRTSKKRYDGEFKREEVRLADNSEKGDRDVILQLRLLGLKTYSSTKDSAL